MNLLGIAHRLNAKEKMWALYFSLEEDIKKYESYGGNIDHPPTTIALCNLEEILTLAKKHYIPPNNGFDNHPISTLIKKLEDFTALGRGGSPHVRSGDSG